jgi:hypothetical protein
VTLPGGVLTRRINATYLAPDGDPAVGRIRFTPARVIAYDPAATYIMPQPAELALDDDGFMTVVLACTDSPGLRPAEWVWICEEMVEGGRRFAFKLPYGDGADIGLSALDVLEANGQGYTEYVRRDLAGLPGGYAPLDSSGLVPSAYLPSYGALAHGAPRVQVTYTTAVLAPGATEMGTLTADATSLFTRIWLNSPARVRLYTSAAQQAADSSRPVSEDPTGDSGCMLEFVGTASLLQYDLSPAVTVSPDDATAAIPITVTNNDSSSRSVVVTLEYLALEGGLPLSATTAYKGTWNSSVAYVPGDIVYYNGSSYACTSANTGSAPTTPSSLWGLLARGVSGIPYTVSGSRSSGAALVSLLSALASAGIITDSTTS